MFSSIQVVLLLRTAKKSGKELFRLTGKNTNLDLSFKNRF